MGNVNGGTPQGENGGISQGGSSGLSQDGHGEILQGGNGGISQVVNGGTTQSENEETSQDGHGEQGGTSQNTNGGTTQGGNGGTSHDNGPNSEWGNNESATLSSENVHHTAVGGLTQNSNHSFVLWSNSSSVGLGDSTTLHIEGNGLDNVINNILSDNHLTNHQVGSSVLEGANNVIIHLPSSGENGGQAFDSDPSHSDGGGFSNLIVNSESNSTETSSSQNIKTT